MAAQKELPQARTAGGSRFSVGFRDLLKAYFNAPGTDQEGQSLGLLGLEKRSVRDTSCTYEVD